MSFENERQYRFAVSLINQQPKGNEMSSPTSPTANRNQWSGIPGSISVEKTVPNMMEALTACIDEQLKIIRELETRCDWVLRRTDTPPCNECPGPEKVRVTLSESLEKLTDRVNQNTSILRNMISRCEL